METSKPVKPGLLADQVYGMLHEAITSGRLSAGSRLRIRDVAKQVGTSATPVLEAIRRLEESGFVDREPHKGAVVKGLTLDELVHVYAVRRMLEREAAGLGSQAITPEDCARMETEYGMMRAAVADGRLDDHLRHDEALLTILYEASGNPVLLSTIRGLWQQCRAYKVTAIRGAFHSAKSNERLWRYQGELLAAARTHDPEAAAAASDASLDAATEDVRAQLAAQRAGTGRSAD